MSRGKSVEKKIIHISTKAYVAEYIRKYIKTLRK